MKLGPMIRGSRERAGLSLTGLAQKARISPSYLCRIENGDRTRKPSEGLLMRLARTLGLDTDAVLLAAGRVPVDVARYLLLNPAAVSRLRREMERAA